MSEQQQYKWVSKPAEIREDRRFVSGKGRYVADVTPPGTLHVGLVTSPHPHARITAIDAAERSRIVYLVRFADEAAQKQAWAAFQGDPEWQRVKSASEADGPLAAQMHSSTLTTTAYWPYDTTVERP